MILEQRKTLERAIPPLAKRFGMTSKRAWEIIENQNGALEELLLNRQEPKTRQKINEWWKQYHSEFHLLGLGTFQRFSRPGNKLPESTYDQFVCLAWLTDMLSLEQFAQRQKEFVERFKKPRITLWQRFIQWVKKICSF